MRLQKATRFGLYAVLELARDPGLQLSAGDISRRYGISTNHLAKVMRELGRAGLVAAERGVGGGYRFAGNAKRTTLWDVVSLFEPAGRGPVEPGEETQAGAALRVVLDEVAEIEEATLRSISIDTMLKMRPRVKAQAA
ncbi:MAG: Rrf2 family transcriptional regulator [Rhodospirillales bacterium]